MSMIYVVNEQDEVIGFKERGTLAKEDIYRITALWLTNSQGQILMAQRALTKENAPGKWGPAVAGTVEVGETYESNIQKEIQEELGVAGISLTKGPKERSRTETEYFCQWYFGIVDTMKCDFTLQKEEVEQVRWFDPSDLLTFIRTCPEDLTYGMRNPERLELLGLTE